MSSIAESYWERSGVRRLAISESTERWFPLALGLITALAVVLAIEPWPVGVFQDDGIYVILAKSLAQGEGYRYLNLPGTPNATHYPPLYPAFLALLWKVYPTFPDNVVLFKFANAALLGISAALFYRIGRKLLGLPPVITGMAVLAFTACRPVLSLSAMVLSEPLFLALLALTLLSADRAVKSRTARDAAITAVLAVALGYTRSIGTAMIPALIMALALQKNWRSASVVLAIALVGFLPWQLWVGANANSLPPILSGKYGPYSPWLADAIRTDGLPFMSSVVFKNVQGVFTLAWKISGLSSSSPGALKLLSGALATILLLVGVLRLWVATPVIALFAASYAFIVLLWPFTPDRFILGIWPLIGLTMFLGAVRVWRLRSRDNANGHSFVPANRLSSGVFAAVAAAMFLGYTIENFRLQPRYGNVRVEQAITTRASAVVQWIETNAGLNAVVVGESDGLLYLYTGRKAVPGGAFRPQDYTQPTDVGVSLDDLRIILHQYAPDYVFVSSSAGMRAIKDLMVDVEHPDLVFVDTLAIGGVFKPSGSEAFTGSSP